MKLSKNNIIKEILFVDGTKLFNLIIKEQTLDYLILEHDGDVYMVSTHTYCYMKL